MTSAYIALGSNLDDPPRQLRLAVEALETLPESQLLRTSGVYRSSAVGPGPQPDYFNAVVLLDTGLSPRALLDAMQRIETDQGRQRSLRWGPRTVDLDLLLYGNVRSDDDELTLPHPRMCERDFVLYPLREISDTTLVLPGGAELDTLIGACPNNSLVRIGCLQNKR
jgi:2-amino-4-hydroxy-6-hydroxymethyldihydropteridine diphosphokinase